MQISLDKIASSVNNGVNGNGPSQTNERVPSSAVSVPAHSMAGLPASELEPRKRRSTTTTKTKHMRSRQLYGAITSSSAGAIYFDVPNDTTIRQVVFSAYVTGGSAADYVAFEVSTSASNLYATADAQGVIAIGGYELVGGGSPANIAIGTFGPLVCPCAHPAKKGDRIYFNVTESGGGTWYLRALVWFD